MNTKKRDHEIQDDDKILLSTKNLIDKKLNKSFIETFQVEKIKDITTTLKLSIFFQISCEIVQESFCENVVDKRLILRKKEEIRDKIYNE